jgi:hypothetical protein
MSITEMPPVSAAAAAAAAADIVPPPSPSVVVANTDDDEAMIASSSSDAPPSESDHHHHPSANSIVDRRVRLSRLSNLVLYMATTSMVVGVVYVGVPAYGVFGDDYLWMRYQVR